MPTLIPIESLTSALRSTYPELAAVAAAGGEGAFLVGGAVRDLLLGRARGDLDVAVLGDAASLGAALGAETVAAHERFGTVRVALDGHEIDLATARTETYERPGALPTVVAADTIEADLARRDFTINAIALPLADPAALLDPHRGRADLETGLVRVLHARSFVDDPTRAIRAARYAARFGFELEPQTAELVRATDLATVSAERRQAELLRLAGEATAPRAYELLSDWGIQPLREGGIELARRVGELLELPLWQLRAERNRAVHAAAVEEPGGEVDLAGAKPGSPSEGVALVIAYNAVEQALARASGADWLDDYVSKWSKVDLEITGTDLIEAGITEGPAVGRGLTEAFRRKLDGEISGREQELAAALEAARAE